MLCIPSAAAAAVPAVACRWRRRRTNATAFPDAPPLDAIQRIDVDISFFVVCIFLPERVNFRCVHLCRTCCSLVVSKELAALDWLDCNITMTKYSFIGKSIVLGTDFSPFLENSIHDM